MTIMKELKGLEGFTKNDVTVRCQKFTEINVKKNNVKQRHPVYIF